MTRGSVVGIGVVIVLIVVVVVVVVVVKKSKKRKKRKKKEKRSSKKCEYCAIWTLFLKFCLAVNDVFFDETPESGPKKIVNRRKNFRSGLNIKNVGKTGIFFGGFHVPK